jgi:glycosyltransferase involved in cell wall biosynthesis
MPEMIREDENGSLFTSGDPVDLARCVLTMKRNPKLGTSLRVAARQAFLARYSSAENYRLLMEIYAGALQHRRPGAEFA